MTHLRCSPQGPHLCKKQEQAAEARCRAALQPLGKQRTVRRHGILRSLLVAFLGVFLMGSLLFAEEEKRRPDSFKKPYLITVQGQVDDGLFQAVKRRVERAQFEGADLIVFEIDTYGGLLSAGFDIAEYIFSLKSHTVAYIRTKAISAGALIALSCRDIVMREDAEIGDCAPIAMTTQGMQELGDKIQSPIRAKFRKFAERNNYPPPLAEAMVTKGMEVRKVELKDGTVQYMDSKHYEEWLDSSTKSKLKVYPPRIVSKEGELLTMYGKEAFEFGFCRFFAQEREDLFKFFTKAETVKIEKVTTPETPAIQVKTGEVRIVELPILWSESLVRFIQAYSFIFFILGILLLYIEFKTPGFGVFGIGGILCFAILFGSNYLTGLAEYYEIAIFIVGVFLVGLEIFVIPGFGITGIAGIALIFIGFYLASFPYTIPDVTYDPNFERLKRWVRHMGLSVFVAMVLIYALSRFLPKTPFFRRIILEPDGEGGALHGTAAALEHRFDHLTGMVGLALTDLRPAGKAEFAEERVDVVAEGSFIKKGAKVRVLKVRGNRVVVTEE